VKYCWCVGTVAESRSIENSSNFEVVIEWDQGWYCFKFDFPAHLTFRFLTGSHGKDGVLVTGTNEVTGYHGNSTEIFDTAASHISKTRALQFYPPSSIVVYTQGRESGASGFETCSGVIPQAALL
jgi:hypothetical protein